MGTLFSQPERYRYEHALPTVAECAEELGKEVGEYRAADVVALFSAYIERAKLAAQIADGDIHDEQLAGFGELLQEFTTTVMEVLKDE